MTNDTPVRGDAFYEFAARNILSSTTERVPKARCNWCDRPAVFKSKLVNPAGEYLNCRVHFAGAGIAGNPE